jgi:hypothetical protein
MFLNFLQRFVRSLAENFANSANVTPNIFNMGTRNPEFDVDFESVEKVTKRFTQGKLEG